MYETGEYVPKDVYKAIKWYKLGSEKGDYDCHEALSWLQRAIKNKI